MRKSPLNSSVTLGRDLDLCADFKRFPNDLNNMQSQAEGAIVRPVERGMTDMSDDKRGEVQSYDLKTNKRTPWQVEFPDGKVEWFSDSQLVFHVNNLEELRKKQGNKGIVKPLFSSSNKH